MDNQNQKKSLSQAILDFQSKLRIVSNRFEARRKQRVHLDLSEVYYRDQLKYLTIMYKVIFGIGIAE